MRDPLNGTDPNISTLLELFSGFTNGSEPNKSIPLSSCAEEALNVGQNCVIPNWSKSHSANFDGGARYDFFTVGGFTLRSRCVCGRLGLARGDTGGVTWAWLAECGVELIPGRERAITEVVMGAATNLALVLAACGVALPAGADCLASLELSLSGRVAMSSSSFPY